MKPAVKEVPVHKTNAFVLKHNNTLVCKCTNYDCGNEHIIGRSKPHFPLEVLIKKMNNKGWKVGNRGNWATCPECQKKPVVDLFKKASSDTGALSNGIRVRIPETKPNLSAVPSQQPEKKETRVIRDLRSMTPREALSDLLVRVRDESGKYIEDWSEERVLEFLGNCSGGVTEKVDLALAEVVTEGWKMKPGWSFSKVAEIVGASESTVKTRYYATRPHKEKTVKLKKRKEDFSVNFEFPEKMKKIDKIKVVVSAVENPNGPGYRAGWSAKRVAEVTGSTANSVMTMKSKEWYRLSSEELTKYVVTPAICDESETVSGETDMSGETNGETGAVTEKKSSIENDITVLLNGQSLEISATVNRSGIKQLKEILSKYEEILSVLSGE